MAQLAPPREGEPSRRGFLGAIAALAGTVAAAIAGVPLAAALGAVWLVRHGDAVTAFSATCPHLGCSVDAAQEGFACPCHGSAFALDGRVRRGPAPRGLDPLEVKVTDGDRDVLVRFRRFAIGTPERREA